MIVDMVTGGKGDERWNNELRRTKKRHVINKTTIAMAAMPTTWGKGDERAQ